MEYYSIAPKNDHNENHEKKSILVHNKILSFFLGSNHGSEKGEESSRSGNIKNKKSGWNIDFLILESSDLWKESNSLGISTSSNKSEILFPFTRLWQPSKLVEDELFSIISNIIKSNIDLENKETNLPKKLQVWDLGCGAGRDLCFLAEETKSLYYQDDTTKNLIEFIGMDRHKASKDRSTLLCKNRMVEDITSWKQFDLKKVHLFHDEIMNNRDVTTFIIFAVRYLNMKLLTYISSEECQLPPDTIYAMSHFCQIDDEHPWEFDHPKKENVLQRNQLKHLFGQTERWKIIKDEIVIEGADGDHGRPMIYFIAQRL